MEFAIDGAIMTGMGAAAEGADTSGVGLHASKPAAESGEEMESGAP